MLFIIIKCPVKVTVSVHCRHLREVHCKIICLRCLCFAPQNIGISPKKSALILKVSENVRKQIHILKWLNSVTENLQFSQFRLKTCRFVRAGSEHLTVEDNLVLPFKDVVHFDPPLPRTWTWLSQFYSEAQAHPFDIPAIAVSVWTCWTSPLRPSDSDSLWPVRKGQLLIDRLIWLLYSWWTSGRSPSMQLALLPQQPWLNGT